MNLPNKLTLLRIIMIPVFVVLLYLDFPFNNLVALAVFILASITDTLDGYIARKYNLITDFGKFMDPIADKLLVTAAMLVFVDWHMMPAWVVIVVVAREFIVSALRLVAANNGRVIAAVIAGIVAASGEGQHHCGCQQNGNDLFHATISPSFIKLFVSSRRPAHFEKGSLSVH